MKRTVSTKKHTDHTKKCTAFTKKHTVHTKKCTAITKKHTVHTKKHTASTKIPQIAYRSFKIIKAASWAAYFNLKLYLFEPGLSL
ncbi:hypothetical protein NP83_04440 [Neobacillus niacini]|nr:hypothetical protein NP83_04440 [Neobacillus niacini]